MFLNAANPSDLLQGFPIADRIREQIAVGELALGARLSDKQLAADLGVSRTPVREALLQLKTEGLVEIRPRSGTFVFDPSAEEIAALCDARGLLEAGAIRLLADVADEGVLTPLHRLVGQAALAVEVRDFRACDQYDWRFHEALIAATGNPYLESAYQGLAAQMRALRQRMPQSAERIENAIRDHRRILDLMSNGRSEDAALQMAAHVRNVKAMLLGRFDPPSEPDNASPAA